MSSGEHKVLTDEAASALVVDLLVLIPESQSGLRSRSEKRGLAGPNNCYHMV